MAENPLLPHRRLQELYALLLRCQQLERRQGPARIPREALLAATLIQLGPSDLICITPDDSTVLQLQSAPAASRKRLAATKPLPAQGPRLMLAAGMAQGLQVAKSEGVVIVLVTSGKPEANWVEAMTYAQSNRLPLILLCADATGGRASSRKDSLTWQTLTASSKRLRTPVLSVDGEDAVAMYRAVQESLIRTRGGDGPVIIWSLLGAAPGEGTPAARMKRYLTARGLVPLTA